MKIIKVVVLVLVIVFLSSAVGLCDAACSTDDATQHCVSCCSAGCHAVVLSSTKSLVAPSLSISFVLFNAALRQEPFLSGIEYPPNILI